MVKLLKTSIVISMSAWLIVLFGCENQPEIKELKRPSVIVSGTILQPSSKKTEKKPAQEPEISEQILKQQLPLPVKKGLGEKAKNPSGVVTEELAKREQIVAVANFENVNSENANGLEIPLRYDPKDRVDPFIPLLQEKEVVTLDIEDKPKRILTPLEKLDLSQIKLVAVILMKNRQLAMVEETTGKGYEVRIGTYMGKNSGQVSKINQSSIVVTEYVKDYKGKRQAHFQEIKLHKKESGE